MNNKEKIIKNYFDMWLQKNSSKIEEIFTKDIIYIESWGPKYCGIEEIKYWFSEWNTRGKVVTWEIKQFFHSENKTIVEWYFKSSMKNGNIEAFDGISLIKWTSDNKIYFLKEFGCNIDNYNPYAKTKKPKFKSKKNLWF